MKMVYMEKEKFIMLKKIRNWFLFSLIPAFIGVMGTLWVYNDSNQIPYFDKVVQLETSLMSKKNLLSHNVELLVDGNRVEKISKLHIYLLNFSKKSYSNVDISVKINLKKEIKILSVNALDEDDKKLIQKSDNKKLTNIFNYNLSMIKRSDKKQFFEMTIFYDGDYKFVKDDIIVTVPNNEPKVRDYLAEHKPNYLLELLYKIVLLFFGSIFSIIGFLVFSVFFISLMSYFSRGSEIKSNKKYAKRLLLISEGIPKFTKTNKEDRKNIIIDLLYQNRIKIWEDMNWLMRIMEANNKPKRSNYEF